MNFVETQLIPPQERFIEHRFASFPIPLTPFWNPPADNFGAVYTRVFRGNEFFLQNKSTLEYEEDLPANPGELRFVANDPLCGFSAYSKSTTVDYDAGNPEPYNGELEKSYVFDETLNEVRLETVETGNHFGSGFGHTRTLTSSVIGNPYASPAEHLTETLSGAVDKSTLEAYLTDWRSKPLVFRHETDNYGVKSTKSESDGFHATVGGGDFRVLPYTFNIFSTTGMTGDIAALWNGNFITYSMLVRRSNAPVLYRERLPDGSFNVGSDEIFTQGFSEQSLSDPIISWRDQYGVFELGDELEEAPLVAFEGGDTFSFKNMLDYSGDGRDNESYFISISGARYRITLSAGTDSSGSWVSSDTYILTTDALSKRTPITSFTHPSPEDFLELQVRKIERLEGSDWITLSDAEDFNDPGALIGTQVGKGFLLLGVTRRRYGDKWGFTSLNGEGDNRYRVKSSEIHLTPGTVTVPAGACGGGLTGSYDAEWIEEYDAATGVLKTREVTTWEAIVNGVDYTPETAPDSIYFSGSDIVTSTATLIRNEATSTKTGRFLVAYDEPDPNGKIVSVEVITAATYFDDGVNTTSEIEIPLPTPGHSVFWEGFRLGG